MNAEDVTGAFEEADTHQAQERYVLCLFVVGSTPRSARMIARVRRVCAERLAGRYELEVIDLRQHLGRAAADDVVAAPTLLRRLPLPVRRIIGEIADDDHLLFLIDPAE